LFYIALIKTISMQTNQSFSKATFVRDYFNRSGLFFKRIITTSILSVLIINLVAQNTGDLSMNYSSTGDGIGRVNYVDNGNFNSGNGAISNCGASSVSIYNAGTWSQPNGVSPFVFHPINIIWPYSYSWYCSNLGLSGHPVYNTSFFKGHLQISFLYNNGTGNKWNYFLMKLNTPLEDGVEYTLNADLAARVLTPGANDILVDRIGFALLDTLPTSTFGAFLPGITPDFETNPTEIVTTSPIHLDQTIIGSGQQYLLIGLFNPLDQMTTSAALDDNYTCKYILDNIWLYRPECMNGTTPAPHVYFTSSQENLYACQDQSITISCTSGFAPYTWAIDGEVQPSTTSSFNFIGDGLGHEITVTCDTGSCATSDIAQVNPRSIELMMPEDTLFSCETELVLNPLLLQTNASSTSWNVEWNGINTGLSNLEFFSVMNPDIEFSFPEPDTFAIHISYLSNTCHYYDTIAVLPQQSLLNDAFGNPLISPIIGDEHCVNMFDGYISFNEEVYPLPLSFDWSNPSNTPSEVNAATNLSTGMYGVTVYDSEGRCNAFEPFVAQNLSSCSYITGQVKVDTTYNCENSAQHIPVANRMVMAMPVGNFAITDSLGQYSIPVPPGAYNVQRVYDNDYTNLQCSFNTNVNLPSVGMTAVNVNFVDTIHESTPDLNILYLSTSDPVVINEYFTLTCLVKNEGDTALAGTLKIYSGFEFFIPETAGIPEFTGISGDTMIFDIGVIQPGQFKAISIPFYVVQNTDIIGDIVTLQAWLNPLEDAHPEENYKFIEREILGAYDPNMKTVSPIGYTENHYISNANTGLDYTIYFQNTGNYPATTVRIEDHLSSYLIPGTFNLTGWSHDVEVSYFDGMLEFTFNDIQLPDSTSDPEGSQGFVSYRIEMLPELAQGSTIENTAYIFFDANPPIITNTVINTIFDCDAFSAAFTSDWTPCSSDAQLNYPATWIDEELWYYQDELISADANPAIELQIGDNSITHVVSNAACGERSATNTVVIPDAGVAEVDYSSTIICPSGPVELSTPLTNGSYEWTLNGQFYGADQNVNTTSPGEYQLEVSYDNCTYTSEVISIAPNPYDINSNGYSNVEDLLVLISEFGCLADCDADINADAIVNVMDITIFIANYNFPCGEE
jgi:uncharacterized repeat protein (TIGR01451 family)